MAYCLANLPPFQHWRLVVHARRVMDAIDADAFEIPSRSMLSWRPDEVSDMVQEWQPHVSDRMVCVSPAPGSWFRAGSPTRGSMQGPAAACASCLCRVWHCAAPAAPPSHGPWKRISTVLPRAAVTPAHVRTRRCARTHTHACAHIKHAHVHSNTRGSGIKAREDLNPVLRARCPSWGGPICLTTRLSVNPKV